MGGSQAWWGDNRLPGAPGGGARSPRVSRICGFPPRGIRSETVSCSASRALDANQASEGRGTGADAKNIFSGGSPGVPCCPALECLRLRCGRPWWRGRQCPLRPMTVGARASPQGAFSELKPTCTDQHEAAGLGGGGLGGLSPGLSASPGGGRREHMEASVPPALRLGHRPMERLAPPTPLRREESPGRGWEAPDPARLQAKWWAGFKDLGPREDRA